MSIPKNRVYITFAVDLQEDEDAGDVADEIIYAVKNFYDDDEHTYPIEIQSISDTIPEVHGREW